MIEWSREPVCEYVSAQSLQQMNTQIFDDYKPPVKNYTRLRSY